MVYTSKDIAHLDIMASLNNTEPTIDIKKILALNSITSTDNLTSNVLALATELRSSGFAKYADSLEDKLVAYKQAAVKIADVHLYRVHDEDGEDMVDRAHPDGDVNVGDGEDGDVETIVSRHKKMVDVVNKEPTGKLGAYVNACKIALGDITEEDGKETQNSNQIALDGNMFPMPELAQYSNEQLEQLIKQKMQIVSELLIELVRNADKELTFSMSSGFSMENAIKTLTSSPTIDNLRALIKFIDRTDQRIMPEGITGITTQTYEPMKLVLDKCKQHTKRALMYRDQLLSLSLIKQKQQLDSGNEDESRSMKSFERTNLSQTQKSTFTPTKKLIFDYNIELSRVNSYAAKLQVKEPALATWLSNDALVAIKKQLEEFQALQPAMQEQSVAKYESVLSGIRAKIDAVAKQKGL